MPTKKELEKEIKQLTKKLEKIKEWLELFKDENGWIISYDLRAIQSRLDNDSEED